MNLALIQHFFENRLFGHVQGDSLFSKPIDPPMPHIHLFTHNLSQYVARDDHLRLDLKKIVTATKNNQVTFQRLSEPILAGWLPTEDNLFQSIANILSYVALGLSIIACLLTVISLRKMKATLLALAAAQQVAKVEAVSLPPQFLHPTPTPDFPTTTPAGNPYHLPILSVDFLSICLLALVLGYAIKRTRKCHVTRLALEVSDGSHCCEVNSLSD